MSVIHGFFSIMTKAWDTLSLLKIDGVSWTSIILAFLVVFFIVGSFFRARR